MLGCSCDQVAHIFWWRHDNRYDVKTIENNRQVRVNIDAALVAIFRIDENI